MPSMRQVHSAKNLFDDNDIKTRIESARHSFIMELISNKFKSIKELGTTLGLGSVEIPSLKSLFTLDDKEVASS